MFDEIHHLHKHYRINWFYFLNSEFSPDKEIAKKFCHLIIDSGIKINFNIKERVECVDKELLGLLKEGGGVAVAALQELRITPATLRKEIESRINRGKANAKLSDIPFTQAAKKSLEYSVEFARHFSHNYIGTEHLLLGILHERHNLAAHVLREYGVTEEKLKRQVLDILEAVQRKAKEDKELNELWKKTRKLSLDALEKIYKELNTRFDNYFFESKLEERAKEISNELVKKKIAEISDGATILNLEKYNLGVWVLLRKDGTVLYSAKDLALAEEKFQKYS